MSYSFEAFGQDVRTDESTSNFDTLEDALRYVESDWIVSGTATPLPWEAYVANGRIEQLSLDLSRWPQFREAAIYHRQFSSINILHESTNVGIKLDLWG